MTVIPLTTSDLTQIYLTPHNNTGANIGGDLQGIVDKLDYLKALGITAIWVSPLFE